MRTSRDRYSNGVDKISSTKEQVAKMQKELTDLQPVLKKTQIEVDEMMVQITADKADADVVKVQVEAQNDAAEKKSRVHSH